MPEIEIASFEDLDGILDLLDSVDVPTDGIDPDFTRFFVIRDESSNRIVGCIGLELFTGTALLRSFAVAPDHQRNKLGSNLIERLLEEAYDAGTETVYLCTAKVPSLFLNIGFAAIDLDDVPPEIRNSELFKGGCPMVAAYMMKRTF